MLMETHQEPAFESLRDRIKKPTLKGWTFLMATPNGLEPSTSSVTGWRANRLHHRAIRVERDGL